MESDQFVERLRALDICDLSDALDALGLAPAVTGLRPLSVVKPIAGRAVTFRLATGPARAEVKRHLGTAAVEASGPDHVIVAEQRTGIDAAAWGGILSRAARCRGAAGVIIDGPARDIEEAAAIGFPIYGRGSTARTARGRIHEAEFQQPVQLGDLTVQPGDYLAADRSGCVAIPAARIGEVLDMAEEIKAKSDQMVLAIEQGAPVSKVMGGEYETMLQKGTSGGGKG